jgi:hypothetical protein|tara:strand:+ start:2469 stop:2765 length:297 start_codon:yes stop_codon:yes gene_type:complete
MEKEEESKMFLENLTKLEKNLWNSHVEFVGVDHDMAEMYAEDRNDVLEVKSRFNKGHMGSLKSFIDRMDTHPREGVVMAFVSDLGEDWVLKNLGYEVC